MCSVLPPSPFAAEKPNRNSSLMEFSLQALLVRHEAYMADAEKERLDMMGRIEELEGQKTGLQKTNETLVEENRSLLDQLEEINNAVAESDTRVLSLQSTLQSAQQEMQRLSHLAAKTERLEQQLADFERDHEMFQTTLESKEQAEKEAMRRWQKAERALADMQSQLDRIEQEAKEERERHVEVVGRMERRRAVEKELTSAAGRLKGAAVSKTTGRDGSGTSVVSHFVKDILQDNANLQMGIVELREMLQNSNGEVESLRQQLVLHQPLEEDEEEDMPRPPLGARQSSLHDEINRATSQELHVHHHYHAPSNPTAAVNGRNTLRRPKKKRYGSLTPNQFTPPTSGIELPLLWQPSYNRLLSVYPNRLLTITDGPRSPIRHIKVCTPHPGRARHDLHFTAHLPYLTASSVMAATSLQDQPLQTQSHQARQCSRLHTRAGHQ
jgi:hypothetical protein